MSNSAKCPDCHKYWEEGRTGLYCPECGQTPQDVAKRQKRDRVNKTRKSTKTRETKEQKQACIQATIDAHPHYGFAKRLTLWLAEYYDVNVKIAFRKMKCCDCTNYSSYSLIRYGYKCLRTITEHGYVRCEYARLKCFWDHEMHDQEAVWAIVLHEFAHALSSHLHDAQYKNALFNLIREFPFADVATI